MKGCCGGYCQSKSVRLTLNRRFCHASSISTHRVLTGAEVDDTHIANKHLSLGQFIDARLAKPFAYAVVRGPYYLKIGRFLIQMLAFLHARSASAHIVAKLDHAKAALLKPTRP